MREYNGEYVDDSYASELQFLECEMESDSRFC